MPSSSPAEKPSREARVIAVTSGKGGVGKTNIAVNMAVALAQMGRRVILWDLDLGLANVDIILNLEVQSDLSDVLSGAKSVRDVIIDTPLGVRVVPGASGDEHLANLGPKERDALGEALKVLMGDADYIIIDTGAGISANTTAFVRAADEIMVVATPEPTAMLDAYATIKVVHKTAPWSNIHLVVNMARDRHDAHRALRRMTSIAEHFISSRLEQDGHILYDQAVGNAVRHRMPFIIAFPDSQAADAIRAIARAVDRRPHVRREASPSEGTGFIQRLLLQLMGA